MKSIYIIFFVYKHLSTIHKVINLQTKLYKKKKLNRLCKRRNSFIYHYLYVTTEMNYVNVTVYIFQLIINREDYQKKNKYIILINRKLVMFIMGENKTSQTFRCKYLVFNINCIFEMYKNSRDQLSNFKK